MQKTTREFENSSQSSPSCPLDSDQLARYTLGNQYAEKTVLSLFQKQSKILIKRLREAKTETERRRAAYIIKESALGIGALNVVKDAERAVQSLRVRSSDRQTNFVHSLERHIQDVNQFIDTRLNVDITLTSA